MTQTQSSSVPPRRRRKKIPTWKRVLFHWRFPVIIVLILMLLVGIIVGVIAHKGESKPKENENVAPPSTEELYNDAVLNSMQAKSDEVAPLVCLTAEDKRCTIDEDGYVTLVTWHNSPELYTKGEKIDLGGHNVWAVTDNEILEWAKDHKKEIKGENGLLRLEQLFGLAPGTGNTHFSVVKAKVDKVLRPAYQSDPTKGDMTTTFVGEPDENYLTWFNNNILASYFGEHPLVWTRLGYTLDWNPDVNGYGLSQFLIPGSSTVSVLETYTNEDFRVLLSQGRALVAS